MKLRLISFREFESEQAGLPSIVDFTSPIASEDEAKSAAYLNSASCIAAAGRVAFDIIDPSSGAALPVGTLTDGEYAWPSALGYYVSKYHIRLPKEFVQRMQSLNWSPPEQRIHNFEGIEFVPVYCK